MDAQELRNLQEAYSQVHQVDEAKADAGLTDSQKKKARLDRITDANPRMSDAEKEDGRQYMHKFRRGMKEPEAKSRPPLPGKYGAMQRRGMGVSDKFRKEVLKRKFNKEEVDLYDIILSHLLDEGYAETPEAAEAIMVNMSEEWRDDILDEEVRGARKGTIRAVIEKGGKSIKYVPSGGDIVAGDRAAQERAAAAEKKRSGKNRANAARAEQARKKSIKNLNARPGEDTQNYGNTDYGNNTPSRYDKSPGGPSGDSHYKLTHSNRAARKRRESGK